MPFSFGVSASLGFLFLLIGFVHLTGVFCAIGFRVGAVPHYPPIDHDHCSICHCLKSDINPIMSVFCLGFLAAVLLLPFRCAGVNFRVNRRVLCF